MPFRFTHTGINHNPSPGVIISVSVYGPYLVRGVVMKREGKTIELTGDIEAATTFTVFGPKTASKITWNRLNLFTMKPASGDLTGNVGEPDASKLKLPALTTRKAQDSLPERLPNHDYSGAV